MAASGKLYGLAFKSMVNGEINWTSHTIKAMLCTSAYTPNQDTHQYKSSVTNESAGTGYTAGGVALAGKTVNYTAGTNTLILDASDTQCPTRQSRAVIWCCTTTRRLRMRRSPSSGTSISALTCPLRQVFSPVCGMPPESSASPPRKQEASRWACSTAAKPHRR